MPVQKGNNKTQRGGDTSRTSSQGRKLASGGNLNRKGNQEMDERTHSPKTTGTKRRRTG